MDVASFTGRLAYLFFFVVSSYLFKCRAQPLCSTVVVSSAAAVSAETARLATVLRAFGMLDFRTRNRALLSPTWAIARDQPPPQNLHRCCILHTTTYYSLFSIEPADTVR